MASPTDVAPSPDEIETQIARRRTADIDPARRGWRLTAYFAVLVGVVAFAAAAASVYVFVQTDRDSRRDAENRAQFAASTAAKQLGDGIATLRATVAGLAATPNIEQAAAQPTCTLAFNLGDLSRGHVDVLRPDGTVACSSRPRAGTKPLSGYAGAAWLDKVGGTPVFLAPVPDAATGDRSGIAAVRSPGKAIVAAFIALEPVGHGLVSLYGGGDPIEFLVTSRDGQQALTRSIDPGRWVGAPLAGTAFAGATGRTDRRDVDGTARLYAEAAVPGVGWHFYAGEDKAAALAAGDHLRERQLTIILVGLALVVLATLAVYRRVVVPIRRLGARVRSTTSLVPPEPVPVSGPTEVRDLGGDINGLIRSAGDELRRREQAEESTRASERSYRLLFENSPLPMWIHDADTMRVLAVNDAAVARYGYTREEFLGLTPAELVVAGDDAGSDGEVEAILGTVRHRRKDGREIKARVIAHSVTFDGRVARCVIAEDVGERERIETQLRQAQKMEAVGQLAGGVAHDFNNLLTVIAGYSGMARNRIGSGPGVRELAEIDRAAERATQLTQQLLTFSRQQVLNPVVLDLNGVVDAVTPMLSRLIGEDIEIGVLAAHDTPPLVADRGQIEQVIVNLAVNARDAMPDGGTLTIETRGVRLDERYAAEHAGVEPGHYACLSVTDTGVGIDRTTQARIFEPFFTTKEVGEGTGLGLATVHGIVDQSGGHLEVYSEPGLGTSFKVYIPAAAGEAVVRADGQPQRPERLRGTETILVCEDDELVRILLQTMLTENGYRVLCASRPDEALSLAATHGSEIDLLVTDLIMPLMSGPELVERLEVNRSGLRVLLLSGYPAEMVRNRRLPEGSVFLQKPFDELSLLAAIRELLDSDVQTSPAAGHGRPELDPRT
jgi:PAS domain S-box-containing protein